MARSDKPLSSREIVNRVEGAHGGTLDDTAEDTRHLQVGGYYVDGPAAVSDGKAVRTWLDPRGYNIPNRVNVGMGSLTTASTGSSHAAVTGLGAFKDITLYVSVTAIAGDTATLSVFVDSKLDGTNYVNLAKLPLITGVKKYAIQLTRRNPAADVDVSADAANGVTRAIGWGDDIRVRTVSSGDTSTLSYNTWMHSVS